MQISFFKIYSVVFSFGCLWTRGRNSHLISEIKLSEGNLFWLIAVNLIFSVNFIHNFLSSLGNSHFMTTELRIISIFIFRSWFILWIFIYNQSATWLWRIRAVFLKPSPSFRSFLFRMKRMRSSLFLNEFVFVLNNVFWLTYWAKTIRIFVIIIFHPKGFRFVCIWWT